MRHVFLTGEIQVGKSTVIRKTLSLLNLPYGGFRTYFGPDRASPDRDLYMTGAALPQSFKEQNVVARFRDGRLREVFAERFDALGARCLSEARRDAKLIVMDECGILERDALLFQAAVLDALEGGLPVFGVVRLAASGWVEAIRRHSNVTLVTVDEKNRDMLPAALARSFL